MKSVNLPKPTIMTARTKYALMSKVRSNGQYNYTMGSVNRGKGDFSWIKSNNNVRLYNLQKFRGKKSPDHKTVIREPHWVAYVYTFDADTLYNLKSFTAKQKTRNFDLIINL